LATRRRTDEQVVRVAPLGELRAYTISEHELEKLEQGAPLSYLLTIGLCLLSADVTVLATLLSTSLPEFTSILFFCALLILGLVGTICTFLGWRLRTSTKDLVQQIRAHARRAFRPTGSPGGTDWAAGASGLIPASPFLANSAWVSYSSLTKRFWPSCT
jgi:hypothetical protein